MDKKNIVILSAAGGNDVVARAIKEQFDLRYKDCEVIIVPMVDYAGKAMQKICDGFYINACRLAPWVYSGYYRFITWKINRKLSRLGKKYIINKDGRKINEEGKFYPVKRIKNIYDRFLPKVIVPVQTLPQGLAVAARKKYKLDCKILCVLSDYECDNIYVRFDCDGYTVDNEEVKNDITKYGIEEEKVKVFGLAASNKFLIKNDKQEMRKHFGLPDRKTVIITGGSFGAGRMKKVFELLILQHKDINIVAIAGRNERLKEKYEEIKRKYNSENSYVFGYTTEFDKLLDTADALICKPGAMSVNEAFLKGVPVIAAYPMPSVEAENVKYFKKHNLALSAKNYKDVAVKLKYLLDNPEISKELIVNITEHSKKTAAKNIADYIYSMAQENK